MDISVLPTFGWKNLPRRGAAKDQLERKYVADQFWEARISTLHCLSVGVEMLRITTSSSVTLYSRQEWVLPDASGIWGPAAVESEVQVRT